MDEAQSHANDAETPAAPVARNAVIRPPSEMAPEELSQLTDAIIEIGRASCRERVYVLV